MEKTRGVHKILLQFKKISLCLIQCHGRVHELVSFLKKSTKTFLLFDLPSYKDFQNTSKIYRNIHRKTLSAIIYRLPISLKEIEIYRLSPRAFLTLSISDVVKTQMVETETWKKFETKTRDQDLKKFSRPRSRLGKFLRDRDETSRPKFLEAELIRIDY